MSNTDSTTQRKQLEQAIAAQESLRGTLDDAIIDVTIAALRKQLVEIAPVPEVKQQRKVVTVLFADVVGSTHLTRELDPEESMAILDTALQRLSVSINTHGGQVLRFMGDGFLAVFGLPQARENDPEMAVRAGLDILDTARTIAQDLERERNLKGFQVRVGANTGLVVSGGVTEAEGTIMGSAINLAARMESAAPPDGFLISQHTYQHVRGIFDFEPGEAIRAKGFAEPVEVYLVKRAKPRAFRLMTRGVEGVETHMIGRKDELQLLQHTFEIVVQNRESWFVTVVGEAGLGKSRLMDEFERWLELQPIPFIILKSRATLESLDLPYALLRDLFAFRFGILDDDPVPVVRNKFVGGFKAAFEGEDELEGNAHFIGQLLGYDFRDSPYLQGVLEVPRQLYDRALVYLADYFKSLAIEGPAVIFLDDIHWADKSSLDTLVEVSNELSGQRIFFVALARPTLFERRSSWGTDPHHQRISLQPLSLRECRSLVGEVLQKVQELPDRLRDLIADSAEGNPFYIEEMIRMLIEDEVIVKGGSAWQVQPDQLAEVRIPPTLTGVIQARLDSLPGQERTVLQQASVVGRVFWDATVSYINGNVSLAQGIARLNAEEADLSLHTLMNREMIIQIGTSAFSGTVEYMFKHTILRDVTYESVLKRTRQVNHAMVAEWLIANSGDRAGEYIGLIAGHLEKAGRKEQALDYMCQAAELAASNYAIDEAVDFYTRAEALAPRDDHEKRYSLLLGQERILNIRGDRDEQRVVLKALMEIADILGEERKIAEVLIQKAWLSFWTSEFSEMAADAQRAATLSETIGDQDLAGRAYYALAWVSLHRGDSKDTGIYARKALSLARKLKNRRAEGNTLNILGLLNIAQGDYFAARNYITGFLDIARELGDREREITARSNLGVVLTLLGDFQSAHDHYQQVLEITGETGERSAESTARVNLSWVYASQQDWDAAKESAEAGIVLKRKFEQNEAEAEGLLWLGHAMLGFGKPGQAIEKYNESLAIRQELEQPYLAMEVLAGMARVRHHQGDLQAAKALVDEIMNYIDGGGSLDGTWEPLRIYLTCYQVLQEVEDPRAVKVLKVAFDILQERASKIPDETYRRMFLENIPWHREIVRDWEAR